MSKKYHFNTKTGNPNICRAEKNCPFGGPEVHFPSKEEARKGYENRQEGSFPPPKKPEQKVAPDNSLFVDANQLKNAPIGALVQIADGTRFVKVTSGDWETSSHGGIALASEELIDYPESKGLPWGVLPIVEQRPVETPEQKPTERPKGTLKSSTVEHAAFEEGMQARRYFLLLNHRDPEQLAAASGKVKDQQLIEDVQELNRLKEREAELKSALDTADEAARNSKTEAQRNGYLKVVEMKRNQLMELAPAVAKADEAVIAHGKRYAKQLVIHRRSLDSIERLANQGVKATPPKVKDRIYKLNKLRKETKSVADLRKQLAGNKPANVLRAAKEFGNPVYVKRAERYANASTTLNQLNNEAAALQRAHNSVVSPKVKESVEAEMALLANRQQAITREYNEALAGIKIFHDDLSARWDQEQDIERELKALAKLSS